MLFSLLHSLELLWTRSFLIFQGIHGTGATRIEELAHSDGSVVIDEITSSAAASKKSCRLDVGPIASRNCSLVIVAAFAGLRKRFAWFCVKEMLTMNLELVINCVQMGVSYNRGTPSHHPFFHGIFHYKPSIEMGSPMTMESSRNDCCSSWITVTFLRYGDFLKWSYPNSWMINNKKSLKKWRMTGGTPMTMETGKNHPN